jgi:DNA-binding LytR/AlgR family response regulator
MNVVIIEDEQLNSEHLERLLLILRPTIQIVAVLETVSEGIAFLKNVRKVDLIFSDIQLADGISFEIFKRISIETPVIFTTAFDQYAIQAFDLNSVAYLLKPVGKSDLEKAIEKFERKQLLNSNQHPFIELESQHLPVKNRFLVKLGDCIHAVKTEEIHHFISEDKVVFLVRNDGKRFPIDFTLDHLETLIDSSFFFRINRKVITHIDVCKKMTHYFNSRLRINDKLLEGEEAIISRERVTQFKDWLNGL